MKRLLTWILILTLVLGLCACGQQPQETAAPTETTAPQPTDDGYSEGFPEELKQHTSPWAFDVAERAKTEKKLHYYFMSGKGMVMNPESDQPTKWGDSTLIVFPNGETMLIDSGVAAYAPLLVENLKRMGIEKLDYFLLSHPHSDHLYGATAENGVFAEIEVGQVYYCDLIQNSLTKQLVSICTDKGIPMEALRKGAVKTFGDVKMEVLWPEKDVVAPEELTTEDINNGSMVVRFDFKDHSSLFTGDLYVKGEADLLAATEVGKLDVDLLKLPHHGYNTSTSLDFVMAASPELAVGMGSPASRKEIQNRLEDNGAIYCHDTLDQYVHAETDGTTMEHDTAWTRLKDQKK